MRIIFLILLLASCFVQAEVTLDQLHDAIRTLIESESEPYHVIDNIQVYEYYSRTFGRK